MPTSPPLLISLAVTIAVIAIFPLMAGYIVLIERKVLADFQVRLGPMRVGPHGLLRRTAAKLVHNKKKSPPPPPPACCGFLCPPPIPPPPPPLWGFFGCCP